MTKTKNQQQFSLDGFLDAPIRETMALLSGKRISDKGIAYAKGVTDDGAETFVFPNRDDDKWAQIIVDMTGIKVRVRLGERLRNGTIKSRMVPIESQPVGIQAVVAAFQSRCAAELDATAEGLPKPAPRKPAKPKAPCTVERDTVRRRISKAAAERGLKLTKQTKGEHRGLYSLITVKTLRVETELTLTTLAKRFKVLAAHETMEGDN